MTTGLVSFSIGGVGTESSDGRAENRKEIGEGASSPMSACRAKSRTSHNLLLPNLA